MAQSVNESIQWDVFWKTGAFLRLSQEEFLLLEGPFTKCADHEADFGGFHFFGEDEQWWKARRRLKLGREELRRSLEGQLGPRSLFRNDFTPPTPESFESAFRLIQGKIQREEIEKAVPILKTESAKTPGPADLAHAFFTLWNLPMNLHVYGFWNEGRGVIGATPETLFELEGTTMKTMALAGSCPKAEAVDRIPLLKDPKELKEHQIVVDDLAIRLKTLGWMRSDPVAMIELPTLFHLITRFEVTGINKTPKEIMRHLHPTPAMGVAPRAYGYQWLKDLTDQKDRGFFGAPLFFRKDQEQSVALVAIRSLFWDAKGARIFAGCGVVAASQAEREFAEIGAKMDSVFQMLGLTQ
ncbi:MAG: chorismate-binding protein [Bdellovibrionaceae bacterium]|nr:chorismate-binding protein [Pseudobdellovibrionaceae bacterium]